MRDGPFKNVSTFDVSYDPPFLATVISVAPKP